MQLDAVHEPIDGMQAGSSRGGTFGAKIRSASREIRGGMGSRCGWRTSFAMSGRPQSECL